MFCRLRYHALISLGMFVAATMRDAVTQLLRHERCPQEAVSVVVRPRATRHVQFWSTVRSISRARDLDVTRLIRSDPWRWNEKPVEKV